MRRTHRRRRRLRLPTRGLHSRLARLLSTTGTHRERHPSTARRRRPLQHGLYAPGRRRRCQRHTLHYLPPMPTSRRRHRTAAAERRDFSTAESHGAASIPARLRHSSSAAQLSPPPRHCRTEHRLPPRRPPRGRPRPAQVCLDQVEAGRRSGRGGGGGRSGSAVWRAGFGPVGGTGRTATATARHGSAGGTH